MDAPLCVCPVELASSLWPEGVAPPPGLYPDRPQLGTATRREGGRRDRGVGPEEDAAAGTGHRTERPPERAAAAGRGRKCVRAQRREGGFPCDRTRRGSCVTDVGFPVNGSRKAGTVLGTRLTGSVADAASAAHRARAASPKRILRDCVQPPGEERFAPTSQKRPPRLSDAPQAAHGPTAGDRQDRMRPDAPSPLSDVQATALAVRVGVRKRCPLLQTSDCKGEAT